ncbi:MAG: hypothetical protein WDO74_19475 [Pseudomonadota bacterium]
MSQFARLASLALALGAASGALGACQSLAGIEDRSYVPTDAGSAGGGSVRPSPECQDYCDRAKKSCQTALDGTVMPGGILYLSDEACLATCARIELVSTDPNSVACRVQQLRNVDTGEDVKMYCANAAPGSNGECGSNCENYCRLFKSACQEQFEKYAPNTQEDDGIAVCVNKCLGLVDTGLFDTTMTGNYYGDTLQCRLVHTSSSILRPDLHCSHAELKPAEKCLDDPSAKPDCKKFCHLEMSECADYPMYENDAQCQAVCEALPRGQIGNMTENTVGCRMYHSYNSMLDPKTHCAHTGPGGDGHCFTGDDGDTGNCESYCQLLEKACPDDFEASNCETDCRKLDGAEKDSGYTTTAAGNNVQCRLLNVSRALSNPKKYCAAALGGAPCR